MPPIIVNVKGAGGKSAQTFGERHKSGLGKNVYMMTLFKNAGGCMQPGSDGNEWMSALFRVAGSGAGAPTGPSVPVFRGQDLHMILVETFDQPAVGFVPVLQELPGLTWHVSIDGEPAKSEGAPAHTCASGVTRSRKSGSKPSSKERLIEGGIFMADEVRQLLSCLPAEVIQSCSLSDLLQVDKFPCGCWYGVTHIRNIGKATVKVCCIRCVTGSPPECVIIHQHGNHILSNIAMCDKQFASAGTSCMHNHQCHMQILASKDDANATYTVDQINAAGSLANLVKAYDLMMLDYKRLDIRCSPTCNPYSCAALNETAVAGSTTLEG